MNILKRIIAFFTYNGEETEMEVTSAEIKENGVFLHPTDDPAHTLFVNSNSVDIFINNENITDKDIIFIDNKDVKTNPQPDSQEILPPTCAPAPEMDFPTIEDVDRERMYKTRMLSLSYFMPAKKRVSFLLYQDEYDMLMKSINENGYSDKKKAEYFLACTNSVNKRSMAANYKRYTEERKKRHKFDLEEAKRAQAEDYNNRKKEVEEKRKTEK